MNPLYPASHMYGCKPHVSIFSSAWKYANSTGPFKRNLFLVIFLLFMNMAKVCATDYSFSGTGNWTDQSKWSPAFPGTSIITGDYITITQGSDCTIDILVRIAGTLMNKATLRVSNVVYIVAGGNLINDFNAVLINNESVTSIGNIQNNGFWTGTGGINTDFTNDGILATEDKMNNVPGVSIIEGNYIQHNNSSYEVNIWGVSGPGGSSGNDQLVIHGDVILGGTINVHLGNGFVPVAGNSFTIMTYNTETGLPNVNFPALPAGLFWVVYNNASTLVVSVQFLLPVGLTSFNISKSAENVFLHWQTASENNHQGFEIEHQDISGNWTTIGSVPGAGSVAFPHNYNFTDKGPLKGMNYYRLKEIAINGGYSYSEVKTIRFDKGLDNTLHIFPNPAHHIVMLLTEEIRSSMAVYEIADAKGSTVIKGDINKSLENTVIKIDISRLSKGLYLLRLTDGSVVRTARLAVQ